MLEALSWIALAVVIAAAVCGLGSWVSAWIDRDLNRLGG